MGVVKVIVNGTTKIDITPTTATASDVTSLKTFFNRNGEQTSGTSGGGGSSTLITKTITSNGTYNASSDDADGYSVVTASIPNAFVITDTLNSTGVEAMITASNGAGLSEPRKQVNFIDYDGTILYSYTAQEANALSALPANPSHSGLTAQGWNWSLAEIKAQLTAMPDSPVWVGQMYITQSGDTEIDVSMPEGRLSPTMTICVNGTITVDWGDNTTADTVTGSSTGTPQYVSHTYAAPGDYTIVIHVVSGKFEFTGSTIKPFLHKTDSPSLSQSYVYANCVQAVRLGNGITIIKQYALYYCTSMAYITIPSVVTSIGDHAFSQCCGLVSITIPSGVTRVFDGMFYTCRSLASVAIPSSVTSISTYVFYTCSSLRSVTIPDSVTSIEAYAFYYCYSLASITIPSGVTSMANNAFNYCQRLAHAPIPSLVTSIGNNVFQNCTSLASITIPSTVTSIGNSAFYNCYGVAEYHIKPTTPPTLGTTVFNNISSDCIIYVPSAKLTDYQAAENWSVYASYMQGE